MTRLQSLDLQHNAIDSLEHLPWQLGEAIEETEYETIGLKREVTRNEEGREKSTGETLSNSPLGAMTWLKSIMLAGNPLCSLPDSLRPDLVGPAAKSLVEVHREEQRGKENNYVRDEKEVETSNMLFRLASEVSSLFAR